MAGYPVGEYSGTRAWPAEALDAAVDRLEADGMLVGGTLTEQGRRFRDDLEARTDDMQADIVEALGPDVDALAAQLDIWSQRCVEAGAFPPDIRKRAAG